MSDQHQNAAAEEPVAPANISDESDQGRGEPANTELAKASRSKTPRGKERLDLLVVERGMAQSVEQARRLIMAGKVLVDDQVSDKPGRILARDVPLRVRTQPPYVSRGGQKLAAALDAFGVDTVGRIAVDVGASTGGFTDCLLQHGASQVFAIDVGYGELAWKLRSDPRVVVLERTNIRRLSQLPHGILADLGVIDASFISLALVLPPTLHLLKPEGEVIALIKPQFEAEQEDVAKGGVVRDSKVHERVLQETLDLAPSLGLIAAGLIASPLLGPAGNVEFLLWLRREGKIASSPDELVSAALEQARRLRKQ